MSFFTALEKVLKNKSKAKLHVQKNEDSTLSLSLVIQHGKKTLKPIIVTGNPEVLDRDFGHHLELKQQHISDQLSIIASIEAKDTAEMMEKEKKNAPKRKRKPSTAAKKKTSTGTTKATAKDEGKTTKPKTTQGDLFSNPK